MDAGMEGVWTSAGHKGEVIANQSGPGKALLWQQWDIEQGAGGNWRPFQ